MARPTKCIPSERSVCELWESPPGAILGERTEIALGTALLPVVGLPVYFPPMADPRDKDDPDLGIDAVDHAVFAHANAPMPFLAG